MPSTEQQERRWLSAKEARLELGLSTNKMAQYLADGTLPHVENPRDKRKKYVRAEDVQRLKETLLQFPATKRAS